MDDSPGSLVGKQIGQFRLDQFLARGAMGRVFKAFDTVQLRTVAVKVISKTEVAGATEEELTAFEEARKCLIWEANAAGRLTHPSIVTIYSYGETTEFVYLCMEYVSGRTLKQILDEQKILPVDETLMIFEQILQAMELAGQQEIVHRDIKPSNIMIGDDGRVKVMDFGIARLPSLALPTAGTLQGTPHYMSPEQISGQRVDNPSAIFSVGAVLYEALTGERPFTAKSTAALIHKILQVEPIPPRVLNIHVPETVGDIINKALAKNPADRFQTPTEMLEALRAVTQSLSGPAGGGHGPIMVKNGPLSTETLPGREEDQGWAATQAPLLPLTEARSEHRAPGEDVPRSPSITEAVIIKPEIAEEIKPSKAQLKDRTAGLPPAPKAVSEDVKEFGRPWPLVRICIGLALLVLIVAGGMALLQLPATPVEQVSAPIGVPTGTWTGNAQNNGANGQLRSSAESLVEQAKSLWENDPGAAQRLLEQAAALDSNYFEAAFQLARFLTFKRDFPAAVQQYQNALRINNQVPEVFFNLGYIYLSQGALDLAIENYEACRALSPPYLDEVLTNLAVCHWKKNNPAQARTLFKEALNLNPDNELARNYLNTLEKTAGVKK